MTDLPVWPSNLVAYRRTPEFNETRIPAGLFRDHATKDGVWARLHVIEGRLKFVDQETGNEHLLFPGPHELIFPGRPHHVVPIGAVRFFVEFCRPADELAASGDPALPHR